MAFVERKGSFITIELAIQMLLALKHIKDIISIKLSVVTHPLVATKSYTDLCRVVNLLGLILDLSSKSC